MACVASVGALMGFVGQHPARMLIPTLTRLRPACAASVGALMGVVEPHPVRIPIPTLTRLKPSEPLGSPQSGGDREGSQQV